MLDVRITSSFENQNLINGFLPFQWQGVEFIAKQPRCAYMRWDTGTGKTLMAEAAILIKRAEGYNLTVYIVRLNHMIGAQRKLKEHTGLDAYVMLGTKDARRKLFEQAQQDIIEGKHPIIICNAEKLSKDKELFIDLITDRKVLFIIDEASKYGNRKTKLYRSTCEVLYKSYATSAKGPIYYPKIGKERAAEMFILALSATPITHNPENLFNVVRLMDPSIFGTVSDFYNRYVAYFDRWGGVARWRNLEDMAVRVKPILHQVNKRDPEIAVQFPESMPHELIYCILDDNTQRIYNELHKDYRHLGVHDISYEEIFPAIQAMQMLVNNPRIVLYSAMLRQQFEDDLKEFNEWLSAQHLSTSESIALKEAFEAKYRRGNAVCLKLVQKMGEQLFTDKDKYGQCVVTKMLELRSQLQEHDEKAIVFSVEQTTQQHIAEWLDHWGITYVIYHGALNIN
ncbi:MAG: DEAD/DEAH box helicase family protein, partial [Nitrososphaerota archaeon]